MVRSYISPSLNRLIDQSKPYSASPSLNALQLVGRHSTSAKTLALGTALAIITRKLVYGNQIEFHNR